MTSGDLLLRMREVCYWGKKCLSMKNLLSRTRILSNSATKRNRKKVKVNFNKTRINIGHQHECWMELKEFTNVNSAIAYVVLRLGHA